jgi:hypothetical protein
MKMLHDPDVRRSIESRLLALRPDSPRQWGSMTPDQMLWHVNQFLEFALGEGQHESLKAPMPLPLFRLALLYMPWPKNAPTHPEARATGDHNFAAERARCLALIDRFTSRPLDGQWPNDAVVGAVSGRYRSRLMAKHLDYHFRQFHA